MWSSPRRRSAIDAVAAIRPLAEVSKSWRDAFQEPMQQRRQLLPQYRREVFECGETIRGLQIMYHSNFRLREAIDDISDMSQSDDSS